MTLGWGRVAVSSMLSSRSQKMSRLALSRLTSSSYVKRRKCSASSRWLRFSGLKQATKSSRSARVSGLFFQRKAAVAAVDEEQ